MDGGVATLPMGRPFQPSNYQYMPPKPNHQQLQKPPSYQQPQQNATQQPPAGVDPSKDPNQAAAGQVVMFDGKRMRKAVHRKTVDYNSAVIKYIENRCWQRDDRDVRAVMPDALYQIDLTPPLSMKTNPMNCVTTKFIRTSTNKFRCPIFCLAWTPEGRRLVTGASSGEFTLWNGLTFNFETILQAHDTSVRAMVWSNNDSWMITGDHSGFIKYWQSNMNNVKMFQGHKEPVRGISFSPSDNKFTTCSDDGTVRIWDFQKCQEEKILRGHGADVKCVGWHPHKSLIASGSKDNQQPLKLWDAKTGSCLATLHAHKMTVMQLQWNKNGNWLLTASRDHLIKLFDIRNMKEEVQTFKGHKKEATAIDWHPIHEGLFASGGSDGAVMFWHVGTDRELGGMEMAHEGMVWSLAWHPLGHILASGSNDHTTKFWTRNRPGDRMRDKYNLNTLGGSEHELPEFDLDNTTPIVTSVSTIPGVNEGSTEDFNNMEDMSEQDISIPGLDWETDAQFLKDSHREQNQRRKIPYSRPIDREFVHAWRSNKQPPAISGEKVDEKPKAPLPSLLELPSVKPAGDFNLETLKDEEGDRHGKQLRQGRNKDFQRDKRGFPGRDRDDQDGDRDERDSRHDRSRNDSQNMDDFDERMAEENLIELQERMDRGEDMRDDEIMELQDGRMGNRKGMMGNQQGMMGNKGMMGDRAGMMGNPQGMMGNQSRMMGPQGVMGNQQNMMGQNRPGLIGNQPPGMMGNRPGLLGNQGIIDKPGPGMMGNQQNMMGQNRPGMLGNQPGGIRGPGPGVMGPKGMMGDRPGFMGNRMGGPMGPQGMMSPGNRMAGPGPQGGQRMPLLGPAPGMGGQGGPNMNRPFDIDQDFRGPNQNQGINRGGGGFNDTDFRNQDSDFCQDSDFRGDSDLRQRNREDRDNRFPVRNQSFDQDRKQDNRFNMNKGQNRQEEMMDFDDRDSRPRGGLDDRESRPRGGLDGSFRDKRDNFSDGNQRENFGDRNQRENFNDRNQRENFDDRNQRDNFGDNRNQRDSFGDNRNRDNFGGNNRDWNDRGGHRGGRGGRGGGGRGGRGGWRGGR